MPDDISIRFHNVEKMLREIRESQIRTEERMVALDNQQTAHDERLNAHSTRLRAIEKTTEPVVMEFSQHDKRLRQVENRQHWYAGASAIFGAGIMTWLRDKTGW